MFTNINSSNNQSILDPIINLASIYFLHPSEARQKIIKDVFQGVGYGDWRRSMVIALSSNKNELGFVDGTIPKLNFAKEKAWERVNSMAIRWLLAVLDQSIARSVLWYKTTSEIWNELEERYG